MTDKVILVGVIAATVWAFLIGFVALFFKGASRR